MKKKLLQICLLVLYAASAQTKEASITIGDNYTIHSKVLNQDRKIQIYLPDGYATSKQKYPVLYILDGQWFFSSGVSVQKALRTPDAIPEMIVVGIKNDNSLRYDLFGDNSDKFTAFLKEEVISFIDSKFRTNKERIIFGWEASAYYISETILKEKGLFTGGIVTDGGNASEEIVKSFKSDKDIYLYIANSKKDIFNIKETEAFNKILKKVDPKNLRWKYELFNDEVHETLGHLAMYKGIKYYYHNYDDLVFESPYLAEIRRQELLKNQLLGRKRRPIKGIKCPRCKSDEGFLEEAQTRSGDEGSSFEHVCSTCDHRWWKK